MKATKREWKRFSFYEREAICRYLEDMASQGWMVEKPGSRRWHFRRIEPKKLHVAATYFPDASVYDPAPTEEQQRMEEYCSRDGWTLAARWGQMQIFYNERENPIPIETDPITQVEIVHRTMRKSMLTNRMIMILVVLSQLGLAVWQLQREPVEFLSRPFSVYIFFAWVSLLLAFGSEISIYFRWHRKAVRLAEQGVFSDIKMQHGIGNFFAAAGVVFLLLASSGLSAMRWGIVYWLVALGLITLVAEGVRRGLKKRGASRLTNQAVSILAVLAVTMLTLSGIVYGVIYSDLWEERKPVGVYRLDDWETKVYDDALPLEMQDLMEVKQVDWSREAWREETVLLANTEYMQWPLSEDKDIPDLSYRIVEVKAEWLYDFCKQGLLSLQKDRKLDNGEVLIDHYEAIDAPPWGAVEAYQHHWSDGVLNHYLLCYPERLVTIWLPSEPTAAQMETVAEKLGRA